MKKMVENEGINFSKKLFGLFLILGVFVIFGMGVFMAYPSSGAGHNADEIDVQIGQTSRTLQQAITDGDFSVWAKSGNNIHYTGGNVGIGTTNPFNYKLRVLGTGSQGGIMGDSNGYRGVFGSSLTGEGVYGWSSSGKGVYGVSYFDIGVKGYSSGPLGIAGEFESWQNPILLRLKSWPLTCDMSISTAGWRASCSSDEKFKEDIKEVSKEKLNSIANWVYNYPLKEFTLKSTGEREIGVIAQEIQKLDASRVSKQSSKDGEYLAVETISNMELVIAIQELKKENNKMKESLCKLGASDWC